MLARTTGLSYVCLRCQRRLSKAKGPLQAPSQPSAYALGRRWAHAAVQVKEDEDNDAQDGGPPPPNNDPSSKQSNPETVAERSYHYRRWRPSKTAKLGVNSLGKPAEVLILPSRDRRIPKVPKEEENRARMSLQESLASEQAPLSIQDLMVNIEQVVRSSGIEKKRGQLEVKEWEILQTSLAKGFKLDQLRRYIAYKHKKSLSTDAFHRVNRQNKPGTIKYLVEEVWGFTVPVTEKHSKKKRRSLSFYIPDEAKLDHLLKDRGQPLKRIAEELDVQIDLFRKESRVRVAGAPANAAAALARISRLAKDLQPIAIPLQGVMGETYRDPALKHVVRQFLDSVQQRLDVQIAMTPDHIKVVHSDQHRLAQQAHRVIRLAVEAEDHPQKVDIWSPESEGSSTLQPFPTPPEFSRGLLQLPWARMVDSSATIGASRTSRPDAERATLLDSMIGRIGEWLRPVSMAKQPKSRSDLHYHMTASFGQALFRGSPLDSLATTEKRVILRSGTDDETSASKQSSKDKIQRGEATKKGGEASVADPAVVSKVPALPAKTAAEDLPADSKVSNRSHGPSFTSQIPYLVQQLALMKRWNQGTSKPVKDIDPAARVTLRLEFSPVHDGMQSQLWPRFEAFVTAGDSAEGKRPPLTITKVSAIYQQKSFTILCPNRHVDLRITQQLRQDIQYRGAEKDQHLGPLLRAIGGYFSRAEADEPTDWIFQPFVTLPLDEKMKRVAEQVDKANTTSTVTAAKKESVTYILRTVDVLDVDSREVAVTTTEADAGAGAGAGKQQSKESGLKYCLDHITLTGTEATWQELRLSERSVLQPPTLSQPHVDTFVRAALTLTDRLGEDPTRLPSTLGEVEVKLEPKERPVGDIPKKKKPTPKKVVNVAKVGKKVRKPSKKASSSSSAPEPA